MGEMVAGTHEDTAINEARNNNELVSEEHNHAQLDTDEFLEDVVACESYDELDVNDCLF